MGIITWPGTVAEFNELAACIERQCGAVARGQLEGAQCVRNEAGALVTACPAHQMMTDRRVMGDLLFGRAIGDQLWAEEFEPVQLKTSW